MSDEEQPTLLDRLVEKVARAMDGLGFSGTRLRWKWNQKRRSLGEIGARGEQLLRSAKVRHKMCQACRALVPRATKTCPECGATMRGTRGPSASRVLTNLLPGVTATTSLILLVNGFWFALLMMAHIKSAGADAGLFSSFSMEHMARFGAGLSEPRLLSSGEVTGREWWRLVTPIFLHWGIIHFFFNAYVLIFLGKIAEDVFGPQRYWVIYFASGIVGSMVSQFTRSYFMMTAGASGAIAGIFGLLLVHGLKHKGPLWQLMKRLSMQVIVFMIVMSFFFNPDHRNHLGGFLVGALMGWFVPAGEPRSHVERSVWQILAIGAVAVSLLAFYKAAALSG